MSRTLFGSSAWLIVFVALFSLIFQFVQCQRLSGIYVDNGMGQTIAHRVYSRREKRNIAREIFQLLQLPPVPAISANNESSIIEGAASRYIHNFYKFSLNPDEAGQSIKNEKILKDSDIIVSYAASTSNFPDKNNVLLKFDLSETPGEVEAVINAELCLYLESRKSSSVVTIHALTRSKAKKTRQQRHAALKRPKSKKNQQQRHRKILRYIDTVELSSGAKGWTELDVTKAFRYWLSRGDKAATLQLSISGDATQLLDLCEEPFLLGYFNSSTKLQPTTMSIARRWKRSFGQLRPYGGNLVNRRNYGASCRMHTLYVRFRELEFDRLIVAPDGYDAQFCAGECRFPLGGHHNATNHAIVQTLVHFLQPGRVPQPCCVPTELDPLPVLYSRGRGTLVLKRYDNMVIRGCGCH